MWPFGKRKPETRSYADLLTAGFEATAATASGDVRQTSAVETAAGLWASALAGADVTGPAAVTPDVLALIGRSLIRDGEAVLRVELHDGAPVLRWSPTFDVHMDWRYSLHLPVPGGTETVTEPPEAVAHFRWSADATQPWRGVGPLSRARHAATLLANVERRLGEEAGAPVGYVLPVPVGTVDNDDDADPLANLRSDLARLKGGVSPVESTAGGWGEGKAAAPSGD